MSSSGKDAKNVIPPVLRLCVVTPSHANASTGGAQYQIDCLLQEIRRRGTSEVTYVARTAAEVSSDSGYRILRIGDGGHVSRFGYLPDAPALYRALQLAKPQVIYQRVGCAYTGIAAAWASRNGARMIWHVAHDNDVMRESLRDKGNPVRVYIEKRSLEYGIRRASQIVAQTQQQADLLLRNYGRKAAAVIPNFQPEPVETIDKSGTVTVVWIAGLKPWKQPEVFVRLARSLADLSHVRFVVAGGRMSGSGDRAWTEKLMAQIAATPNLDYIGEKSQAAVNELLARSHLFVNTSLFEGFPNTFIQAWMREVPVVSLTVNPDGVLDSRRVGIHASDEASLADSVRKLVADGPLRQRMAEQARRYALERHSMRNAAVLADLLEGAG
jgi:glycosyltransferase involved in cell wall biosynthesis